MKSKLLLLIICFSLNNFIYSQEKITADIKLITFLGRVPHKTKMNALPDNLLRILYYEIQPENILKTGYMNGKGEIIVEPKFNLGSDFYGDTANIIKDSTFGYIDKNGVETLLEEYDKTFFYYGKSGIAKKNGKYALINRKGEPLTDFNYVMISFFGDNFYQVYLPDKTSQIIDSQGEIIFNKEKNYNIKSHYFEKDSIVIFQDIVEGKKLNGLVTKQDEIILQPKYEEIRFINDDKFSAVMINNKWGFIDKQGNEVIPAIYEEVDSNIIEDLIVVKKNNKWGYINRKNEIIIPFDYDKAHAFVEDLAFVKKGEFYGCINKENQIKIEFKLEETSFPFFLNDLALFKIGNKYGFINKKGKVKIPAIYDNAYPFFKEKAYVELNGKVGFINTKGKEIIPIEYKQIWFESEDIIRYAK